MQESNTTKQRPIKVAQSMLLFLFLAFAVGLGGYLFISRGTLISYVLAHLGALGILGFFGWIAGFIAMKKGRHFYSAFLLAGILPILTGASVVLIAGDSVSCGGSISLATAVLVLVVIVLLKKKNQFIT